MMHGTPPTFLLLMYIKNHDVLQNLRCVLHMMLFDLIDLVCSILSVQLPEDCRLAAVFVAGLSLGGTISELSSFFIVFICLTIHCFIHLSYHLLFPVNSMVDDGESDEQVVLVSQSGTVNRIKVKDISIQSRYAR